MSTSTYVPAESVDRDAEEEAIVHAWRVSQLVRLGLDDDVAEAVAGKVDWHEVASLVDRGCLASLALAIVA